MTDAELGIIEHGLAAAAQGPWRLVNDYDVTGDRRTSVAFVNPALPTAHATAYLVVHAPTWLAALVAEVRRLREERMATLVDPNPAHHWRP
jgi:hypothetical protein